VAPAFAGCAFVVAGRNDGRLRYCACQALAPGADQWRMLLQIDSDENAMFEWGDCGQLFFWITEDALNRRAFDEVWMILQCS